MNKKETSIKLKGDFPKFLKIELIDTSTNEVIWSAEDKLNFAGQEFTLSGGLSFPSDEEEEDNSLSMEELEESLALMESPEFLDIDVPWQIIEAAKRYLKIIHCKDHQGQLPMHLTLHQALTIICPEVLEEVTR